MCDRLCSCVFFCLIQPFCALTGYPYEMYVDPERCIYQKLGMKREEIFTDSGNAITIRGDKTSIWHDSSWWRIASVCMFMYSAHPSPHVKSGMLVGQMKSIWRAMTSPIFDFQGDLHQQGGSIIAGPGELYPLLYFLVFSHILNLPRPASVRYFPLSPSHRLSSTFLPFWHKPPGPHAH